MSKTATPQIQMQYLDRIKKAIRVGDKEMLSALYGQCKQLNIVVPHYEITEAVIKPRHAINRPAVEKLADGTLSIHMYEFVEIGGVSKSLKDWCKEINLDRGGLRYRLSVGQSLEEALTNPKVIYWTQKK